MEKLMEQLIEHAYGTSAFMRIRLDDGTIGEIDVYWKSDGKHNYKTDHDDDPAIREKLIEAFNALY